jgi:hypothetical protein
VHRWQEVTERIRRQPCGDNYDFSLFKVVVGVVCTPQVIYVAKDVLEMRAAPSLPVVVSIDELGEWLR